MLHWLMLCFTNRNANAQWTYIKTSPSTILNSRAMSGVRRSQSAMKSSMKRVKLPQRKDLSKSLMKGFALRQMRVQEQCLETLICNCMISIATNDSTIQQCLNLRVHTIPELLQSLFLSFLFKQVL